MAAEIGGGGGSSGGGGAIDPLRPSMELRVSRVPDAPGNLQVVVKKTGNLVPVFMERLAFPAAATSVHVMVLGPVCKLSDKVHSPPQGCPVVWRTSDKKPLNSDQLNAKDVFTAKRGPRSPDDTFAPGCAPKWQHTPPETVAELVGVAKLPPPDADPVFKWVIRTAVTLLGTPDEDGTCVRRVMILGAKVVWVPPGPRGGAYGRGGVRAFSNTVLEFPRVCESHRLCLAPPHVFAQTHPAFFVKVDMLVNQAREAGGVKRNTSLQAVPIIASTNAGFGAVHSKCSDDQALVLREFSHEELTDDDWSLLEAMPEIGPAFTMPANVSVFDV